MNNALCHAHHRCPRDLRYPANHISLAMTQPKLLCLSLPFSLSFSLSLEPMMDIGIVVIRFVVAVMFQWKLGDFMRETYEQCMQRSAEIENLFSNIYHPTRSRYCPSIGKDGLWKKENCKIFFPNTFTFIFSGAFFKGSDGRRKTVYGMLYFSLNPNWKHSTMYGSSHLQTSPSISFREAQCPYLVVLLLIASAPSLSSTSFISLLQNMNSSISFSQYVWSTLLRIVESPHTALNSSTMTDYPNSLKLILVIADRSLLMVYLRAPEIHWRLLKSIYRWPTLLSLLRALNLSLMSPSWMT